MGKFDYLCESKISHGHKMTTIYRLINRIPLFLMSATGIVLLLLLTLLPSSDLPEEPAIPFADKVAHFLAFGLVVSAMVYDFGRYKGRVSIRMWVISAFALTGLGVGIEFMQEAMGIGRSADVWDAVADAAGSFLLPLALWPLIRRSVENHSFHLYPSKLSGLTAIKVKSLYFNSFPDAERREWNDLSIKINAPDQPLNLFIVNVKGRFAGFITWWRLDGGLRYVEHFAIDPSLRGAGTGARAIKEFVASEPSAVILEVEPEDMDEMARRRIGFYRRCGFTDHPEFDYEQPPYAPGLPTVKLTLMTSGDITPDLENAARQLHGKVYGVHV